MRSIAFVLATIQNAIFLRFSAINAHLNYVQIDFNHFYFAHVETITFPCHQQKIVMGTITRNRVVPDPDYEVIEFSSEQQYSNAMPIKATKQIGGLKCELCGSMTAKVKCDQCNQQFFCASCDDMFHRHPKRNTHIRKVIVG